MNAKSIRPGVKRKANEWPYELEFNSLCNLVEKIMLQHLSFQENAG